MRLTRTVLVAAILVLFAAAPALAAQFTYNKGDTVALGFNQLSSSYTVYWYSDRDGYIASGNPLRTTSLSVGSHTITYLIYQRSTLVYRGTVTVDILQPSTPSSNPGTISTGSTGSSGSSSSPRAPGEFETVKEFLLGTPDAYSVEDMYPEFLDALRGIVKTTIYVDNQYTEYDLEDLFVQTGVDDTNYSYVVTPVDSIWMRDYGPLFTKSSGSLGIVDMDYYPNRPNDDAIPSAVGRHNGIPVRRLRLSWEGGNYTSDGAGNIFATDAMLSENYGSTSQIASSVRGAFYGQLNVLDHMLNDGGTGHLDMFAFMTGPHSFFVNKFPAGHQNAARMDGTASRLQSMGYTVTRLDLADTGFSSYTNGVLVNGVALVPTYGKSTTDNRALAAYRAAGYRAVGIDSRRIINWSGAIHCITITVPN